MRQLDFSSGRTFWALSQWHPCQDVSSAGKQRGLGGQRSGLWYWFAAIVDQVRPRTVIVENVASGARHWLPTVRRALHLLGYDSTAYALSAADVGAPHLRRRVFVVAHAHGQRRTKRQRSVATGSEHARAAGAGDVRLPRHADGDRKSAVPVDGEVAGLRPVAGDAPRWPALPELRRVDDELPSRLDRLRALGNAVVPACAEVIGRIVAEQIGGGR